MSDVKRQASVDLDEAQLPALERRLGEFDSFDALVSEAVRNFLARDQELDERYHGVAEMIRRRIEEADPSDDRPPEAVFERLAAKYGAATDEGG